MTLFDRIEGIEGFAKAHPATFDLGIGYGYGFAVQALHEPTAITHENLLERLTEAMSEDQVLNRIDEVHKGAFLVAAVFGAVCQIETVSQGVANV